MVSLKDVKEGLRNLRMSGERKVQETIKRAPQVAEKRRQEKAIKQEERLQSLERRAREEAAKAKIRRAQRSGRVSRPRMLPPGTEFGFSRVERATGLQPTRRQRSLDISEPTFNGTGQSFDIADISFAKPMKTRKRKGKRISII